MRRGDINKPSFRRDGTEEQTAVRGFQKRMDTSPVAGGGAQLVETSLLRANFAKPRQWLVTLAPPMRGAQPLPYRATFSGVTPGVVPTVGNFGAPPITSVGTPQETLAARVRWGAGGVRSETAFDYPMTGGTFAITADSMDISVAAKFGGTVVFGAQDEIPVVAGWYVEGAPVDATPMAWAEIPVTVAGGNDVYFAIKPYAKTVTIRADTTGAAVERIQVEWLKSDATLVARNVYDVQAPSSFDLVLEPVHAATVLRLVASGAVAKTFYVEWGIGLS